MTYVIIGAGLAGAKAAETLRQEGFDGHVVLVGAEPEPPYERPPLSKGLMLGTAERESVYVHDRQWYAENSIELRTATRAIDLDAAARRITLADGAQLTYDRLVLATGSSPRHLDVPGGDLAGVHYLRTLADSDAIASVLAQHPRLVIIGAGWIGLELAAAARHHGCGVTVVEQAALPLQRVLGDEVAEAFAALHRAHGVTFHFQASVAEFSGTDRVSSVRLGDGTELAADAVIVGVGIEPNIQLAQQAGLKIDNGILVDAALRTSDPAVWAAGDVANAYHPVLRRHIRVEHWANALNAGPAAARAMLGQAVAYDPLPYFFTDQYDLGMEYSGYVPPGGYDQVLFRGSPQDGQFLVFWIQQGQVLAGMNVNIWDVHDEIRALISAGYTGRTPDLAKLTDPAIPLGDCLR